MVQSMLTTTDNPYDPFDQFDEWLAYDTVAQHYTPAFLARVAYTSDELSDTDQALAIEQAIDEIVSVNVIGIYKKVSRDVIDTS